jgi:hypothetical protein
LVQDPNQDTFTAEVDQALDNLFGEPEPDNEEEAQKPSAPEQSPFTELKTIVLSIDWEITDEVMDRFIAQVGQLQTTYKDDKIVLVFLQLLGSIGEYIRTNLGQSHPDAFRLLNSLFAQMDRVLHTENLPETERKKILSSELTKYKKLKSRLQTKQAGRKDKPPPAEVEPKVVADAQKAPPQPASGDLQSAVKEIKQLIREEFKALRAELKLMQKR